MKTWEKTIIVAFVLVTIAILWDFAADIRASNRKTVAEAALMSKPSEIRWIGSTSTGFIIFPPVRSSENTFLSAEAWEETHPEYRVVSEIALAADASHSCGSYLRLRIERR